MSNEAQTEFQDEAQEEENQDSSTTPLLDPSMISKIELAKALKTLRDVLPDEAFANVRREALSAFPQFAQEQAEAELNRSLTGLSAEDDFALMCRLMESVRHVVGLEQRPLVSPKPDVPDFLLNLRHSCRVEEVGQGKPQGYSYLVDVKHTEADKKKISGDSLRRLRDFADHIGFPLLFAVRFDKEGKISRWSVVEDHDRTASSITITKTDPTQIGHLLWADLGVLMPKGTFFMAFFDHNATDGRFLHPKYGGLLGVQFIREDGKIERIGDVEHRLRVYILFSQIAKVAYTDSRGSQTREVMVAQTQPRLMSELVQFFNSALVDDVESKNHVYNPSRILPRLDVDPHDWLINRARLDNYVRDLCRQHVLHLVTFKGTPLYHQLQGLRAQGSTELPDFKPEN